MRRASAAIGRRFSASSMRRWRRVSRPATRCPSSPRTTRRTGAQTPRHPPPPGNRARAEVLRAVDPPPARSLLPACLVLILADDGCASHRPVPGQLSGELTIAQLHSDLAGHKSSVRDIERHYSARLAELDTRGPTLRSVLEVNPDAAAIAATLDAGSADRGPLFGVPVLIKDNIDTADRMLSTAGSLALVDSRPARDSFIVQRLRAAGALILGKTNLSEWANYRSKRSSSGWSGRGGQTRNPYALDGNACGSGSGPGTAGVGGPGDACGSTSGCGTAVAADLAVVAVGTETDGSITCPASVTGLVGIKPTVGLVSRSGIIPISASQDTAGPMARNVADAATLLTVLAGYDPADPATAANKERAPIQYTQFLNPKSLEGARVGVLRQYAGFHEEVDAEFARALEALRAQGAVL